MHIEIWSDVKCPWCFVGKRRFEKALAEFPHRDSVDVTWKSFQLDPNLPESYDGTELQYLSERKGLPQEQVRQMWGQLKASAADVGVDFDFDSVVVGNSFPAHRFLHLAKSLGKGNEAKEAVLSAHFEQGLNTSDVEVLIDLGETIGIPEQSVRETMSSDRFAEDVRRDINEAQTLGVSGVPFFVIDRKYGISGAQPVEFFRQALDQAWREAHPLVPLSTTPDGEVCGPDGC